MNFLRDLHTLSKTTLVAPFNSTAILTPDSTFGVTMVGAAIAGGGGGGGNMMS
jgi:hypothetical protein